MATIIADLLIVLVSIGLGFLLLVAGRRYYPLFVGIGGFLLVRSIFDLLSAASQPAWLWLVALSVGVGAAFVAPRFETWSLRIAGFVLGGYVTVFLLITNGYFHRHGFTESLVFVIGGILGLLSIGSNRNEWLITLSSLAGAALMTEALSFSPALRAAAYAGLAAAGMLIQAREWILPTLSAHRLSVPTVQDQD